MNTTITPKKRKVLRELAAGMASDPGRPTKQALVRDGLCVYLPSDDPLLNKWDRPIAITGKGRRLAGRL